ncbi:MAG: hypothetical protein Q7U75_19430 [Desulfobacterales bacterium]|nr:hypothetical protein [Desulfobacterales bacterium]
MNTKQKTGKGDVVARLSDIEVQEVSMVDKGANRRKWAFVKSASDQSGTQELVDRYHAAKAGDEEALIAILKELLSQLSPEVLAKLGLQPLETDGAADEAATEEAAAGEETMVEDAAAVAAAAAAAASAAQKAASDAAAAGQDTAAQLKAVREELAVAKAALAKVGEPQTGREPRAGSPALAKREGDIRTLGCRTLNK